jgi:hypothetical protein
MPLTRRGAFGSSPFDMDFLAGWQASSTRRFCAENPKSTVLAGALVASAFSTLWLLLQAPDFLSGYDFQRMHVFYRSYFREALLGGRLPLWNPYVGLGRPFLADIETATLYPPTLLVLPLGVIGGTVASVFLHQALAIYGGVRLGRLIGASAPASWLVGIGFALGSPVAGRLATGMVEVYFSMCWWPVMLWLGASLQDRWDARVASGFAASVGLAVLAGNPPILYVEVLGLAVFLLFRHPWTADAGRLRQSLRNVLGVAASGLLGAVLAAVQLLPFLELLGQGNRPLASTGFATADGMQATTWISLLVPVSANFGANWEYNLHVGLVPLFAAASVLLMFRDRNTRALLGLGLFGALMAAGAHTPFLGWAVHVLPGASALRLPSRYGLWLTTAVLGAGALALSGRQAHPLIPLVLCFATSVAGIAWLGLHMAGARVAVTSFVLRHIALAAVAAALVGLWCARPQGGPRRLLGWALAAFCALNWLWAIALEAPLYSDPGFRTHDREVREAAGRLHLFQSNGVPPRLSFNPGDVRENAGMIQGFGSYTGYSNPFLARVWTHLHIAAGVPLSGVDYIQMPEPIYDKAPGFGSLALAGRVDHQGRSLEIFTHTDPRAYIVFDDVVSPDWATAERWMSERRDFHERAYLEAAEPGFASHPGANPSSAEITQFGPERISVATRSPSPAILVLAEAWYPGWEASIEGTPAPVFPVNGWMRGVVVPSGAHSVVYSFRQRHLESGLALSLAALSVLLVMAAWGTKDAGKGSHRPPAQGGVPA